MSLKRDNSALEMSNSELWYNIEHLRRTLLVFGKKPKQCVELRSIAKSNEGEYDASFIQEGEFNMQNCALDVKNQKSSDLLKKIEVILGDCIKQQASKEVPTLSIPNRTLWKNTSFDKEQGLQMNLNPVPVVMRKCSDFRAKRFGLTLHLLSKVYFLIKSDKYCTKRELYYQDIKLYNNQRVVDSILDDIACMLGAPKIQLHVLTSSKGYVAGHLYFKDSDGNYIDCTSTNQGLLLPNDIDGITHIHSEARFILIVEKDAVFQMLLESDIMRKLHPCIIITGKGFPDVNTRQMVHKLWDSLQIPILALVDDDPYGIEILCIYTYGSKALSFDVKNLAVPVIRWIGVFPSDIQKLKLPESAVQPLTANDNKRAKSLLSRPYMQYREGWHQQVELMLMSQKKAEIEGLCKINQQFLANVYLPNKIRYGGWI